MTALGTLQAHRLIRHSAEDAPECSCGLWEPGTATRDLEEHDEHVAAMLTAADREALEKLTAEVEPWLQECGSCDAGLPMGCTCPQGDYRNILLKVWRAYEQAIS